MTVQDKRLFYINSEWVNPAAPTIFRSKTRRQQM